jgi:hypothetical protein
MTTALLIIGLALLLVAGVRTVLATIRDDRGTLPPPTSHRVDRTLLPPSARAH